MIDLDYLSQVADQASFAWENLIGRDKWVSFDPEFGSLTVVGATDYKGRLRIVGKKCEFQVVFHAATSVASTAGTDYLTLPITAKGLSGEAIVTADNANLYVGTCHIDAVTSRCYLPTIVASSDWFTIAGWFEIQGPSITRTGGGTWAPPAVSAATIAVVDAAGDTTTFPMLAPSATGSIGPLTDAGLSYDASTNILTSGVLNVPTGGAYTINGINVLRAQTSDLNFYFGNGGNLTATGDYNVAVGNSALSGLTTGSNNVAVGASALYANTTGGANVALGPATLTTNEGGSNNIALGNSALTTNLSGDDNIAFGDLSLSTNSTGHRNIAIGKYAGAYETGSDAFYVNNQNRTNTAGDKAKSLMYGTFNANEALQTLKVNGTLSATAFGTFPAGTDVTSKTGTGTTFVMQVRPLFTSGIRVNGLLNSDDIAANTGFIDNGNNGIRILAYGANASTYGTITLFQGSSDNSLGRSSLVIDGNNLATFGGAVSIPTTLGVTGVATFTAQPILSSLTASLPVLTDASKGLISGTQTGTGTQFVMSGGTPVVANLTVTSAATVGTTLGVTGVVSLAEVIQFTATAKGIFANTADGSDNFLVRIGGGGAAGTNRGGYIDLSGNERGGSLGSVNIYAGQVTGGLVTITSGGVETIRSTDAGTLSFPVSVTMGGNAYPTVTGTNDQVLTTNGSGTLSWSDKAGGGGGGITSLNSQTGANQTFTNDTNVTIASSGNAHVITWSGTVAVARGGTGAATLTGLLQGNGTSAITGITNSSTVGQVLRVTGTSTYAWGALNLADSDAVTGILPALNGGSIYITPSMYGTVGTADDASVFDLAIADAISTGRPLLLDRPTYTIVTPLTDVALTANQRLTIVGMGSGSTSGDTTFTNAGSVITFAPTSGTPYLLTVKGASDGISGKIHFSNFAIYCNGSVATGALKIGATGAGITSTNYHVLENLSINNCSYYGVRITDSARIKLDNVYIDQKDLTAYPVLYIEASATAAASSGCGDMICRDCTFEGTGTAASYTVEIVAVGKDAVDGASNVIAGLHFVDCIFYYGERSLYIHDTNGTTADGTINDIFIESCAFDGSLADADIDDAIGINIYGTMSDFSVADTYINSYNSDAVDILGQSGSAIANLSFENNYIGRCLASGFNINTSGTIRSLNITNNNMANISPATIAGANGNTIVYMTGDIKAWNVSGNNHYFDYIIGTYEPPDWVVRIDNAGTDPDDGLIMGNVGRWMQAGVYTNAGAGANITAANNIRQPTA